MSAFRKSLALNALFSALGAVLYVAFGAVFARKHGLEEYAAFALISNAYAAVLVATGTAGYYLRTSVTKDLSSFWRSHKRLALPGAAIAATLTGVFLIALPITVGLAGISLAIFLVFVARNLPFAALLARDENWITSALTFAQITVSLAVFYTLYCLSWNTSMAYSSGLLFGGLISLAGAAAVATRLLRRPQPGSAEALDLGIRGLFQATLSTGAVALLIFADKVFIARNQADFDAATLGVYFISWDILTKVTFAYRMLFNPLTREIIRAEEARRSLVPIIVRMFALNGAVVCVLAILLLVVAPTIYDFDTGRPGLMAVLLLMICFSGLNGVGYLVLALCNALAESRRLLLQNILSLALAATAFIALHLTGAVNVAWIAAVMCLGQFPQVVTLLSLLMARRKRGFSEARMLHPGGAR